MQPGFASGCTTSTSQSGPVIKCGDDATAVFYTDCNWKSRLPIKPMMSPPTSVEERLIALELLTTHLERDLLTLNAALLDQQKELAALKRLLARLDDRVTQLGDEEAARDPRAERPPHY